MLPSHLAPPREARLGPNQVTLLRCLQAAKQPENAYQSPPQRYRELPFPSAQLPNPIYALLRRLLSAMSLDVANTGTAKWNPLAALLRPGGQVLVKPGRADHRLIRAICDYAFLATGRKGQVLLDASILQLNSAYVERLPVFYASHGFSFAFADASDSAASQLLIHITRLQPDRAHGLAGPFANLASPNIEFPAPPGSLASWRNAWGLMRPHQPPTNPALAESLHNLLRVLLHTSTGGGLQPNPQRNLLTIVDAIHARHGDGSPAPLGCLLASTDPLAAERAAVRLARWPAESLPHIPASTHPVDLLTLDTIEDALHPARLETFAQFLRPAPGWESIRPAESQALYQIAEASQ